MISIVIVGRNDNYGGDFEGRLMATTRYNLSRLERRRIDAELIFVEWNPLPDRPFLSEKIVAEFDSARCFVVDASVHRLVSGNRHIQVYEYPGKNVGARRARGDWLLITNPDDFFGDDVIDFLATGAFEKDTLYRAGWIEIDDPAQINGPNPAPPRREDPPPYLTNSGDFIMCSKSLFDRIGGFREDLAFSATHMDTIFCQTVFDLTGKVRKIGNTYHLRHGHGDSQSRWVRFDWHKAERGPQPHYGLAQGWPMTEHAPQIMTLTVPDELINAANSRGPIDPEVPRALRPPSWFPKQLIKLRRFARKFL
jgi:hypothetical protein